MATDYSDGYDTRYLLSFGPFEIDPGETLPVSFAVMGGENFHVYRNNLNENILGNYNPDRFYANLSFKDLTTNARWASWIYDNPGVDTDGDGYYGKSVLCIDTINTDTGFIYDTQINKDWWISYGSLDRSNNYHFELVKKWNSETIIDLGIYSGIVEK